MQTAIEKKLASYVSLDSAERLTLSRLQHHRSVRPAGATLVDEGQPKPSAYILASGWVFAYKGLRDGSRQIIDVQVPGDLIGARNVLFRTSEHSFEALTDIVVSEVSVGDLFKAFGESPRLAAAMLWAASCEEAMVVEHLVDIGRRSAIVRTAHYLLELGARMKLVGLGDETGFACPLSQFQLADALGLTAIHVNRMLRQLREKKLLTFQKGRVAFDNLEGLVALAEFDMSYLDHSAPLLDQRLRQWGA